MKIQNILVAMGLVLVSWTTAFAGATNISVKCTSASGRTFVKAWIPGNNAEQSVEITVDHKKLTYINQDMVDVLRLNHLDPMVLFPAHQVQEIISSLTETKRIVVLAGNEGEKEPVFFMNASDLTKEDSGYGDSQGTFVGELSNTIDPRNFKAELPSVLLNCTYSY